MAEVVYPDVSVYPAADLYPVVTLTPVDPTPTPTPAVTASRGRQSGAWPPITNATLTAVTGAGFSDDYDDAATAGASKWTGEESVFYRTSAERVDAGGTSDVIVGRSLVVDADMGVDFAIGDVLSWTYLGVAQSATVRRVAPTTAPGLPGVIRLVIEDG